MRRISGEHRSSHRHLTDNKEIRSWIGSGQGSFFSRPAFHLLLVTILGFLVYSNTFHSPFQWDEAEFITNNPAIKDLSGFLDPSRPQPMSAYSLKNRYLAYLTFALNYRFGGFDVFGYHVVNLAIHLINAMLVYLLVLLTFRTPFFGSLQSAESIAHSEKASARLAVGNSLSPLAPGAVPYARFFALAVALLFVAHPVQTEAVTYIFQRFASLAAMFYLLSLVLYIKARLKSQSAESTAHGAERPVHYAKGTKSFLRGPMPYAICSLFFTVLAMKTKENAFTLPVMIALYEFLFFTGKFKSRVIRLAPFLLTMLIIPMTVLGIEGSLGEVAKPMAEPTALGYENLSRGAYFFTQFRVIVTYIRLLFLPINQNLVYDYPVYHTLLSLPVLLSALFLMVLFGSAVYIIYRSHGAKSIDQRVPEEEQNKELRANRDTQGSRYSEPYAPCAMPYAFCYRLIGFGILWFFITLSVESSFIPLAMVIDEYRVYLPSVGFFIAAVTGIVAILQRFPKVSPKGVVGVFLIIILGLSSATYVRNRLWISKISLWEDVLSKNANSPKVYNNLGIAYYEQGHYEKAIDMYSRAISLSPDNHFAYSNLGVAYASIGRIDSAINSFTKAVEKEPGSSTPYANLARAYRMRGDLDRAVENYIKAVNLNPFDSMAFYGLGSTFMTLGRLDDALDAYNRFVELSPRNPEAYKNRGIIYARKGNVTMAAADFREACALGSMEGCTYAKKIR